MADDELKTYMSRLSNLELYEIVHSNPEDYQPEARLLAEEVFHSRDLSEVEVAAVRDRAESRRREAEDKASENLPWPLRIFFAFISGILVSALLIVIVAGSFERRGRTKWATDAWRFFGYGLVCYFGLVLLGIVASVIQVIAGRAA